MSTREEQRLEGSGGSDNIQRRPVRIGTLFFKYDQPEVNVTTEANTVEHETLDETVVIQQLNQRPDQITIKAVVAGIESKVVDQLTETEVWTLRSTRWSGTVIVTSTDTTFMRAVDEDNNWLYRATITCTEVDRTS